MSKQRINEVQKIAFSISYDGKDTLYEKHQIRADDLSKIIGSMNDLILKSDFIVNKTEEKVPLITVTAPIKEGSVIIEFLVSAENIQKTLEFIGLSATSGVIGASAFELVKKIGNRAPNIISINKQNNIATVKIDDKNSFNVPIEVVDILKNQDIRKSLENIVYLPTEGKNASIKISDSTQIAIQEFTPEIAKKYKIDQEKDIPSHENITTTVKFTKVNLDGPKGWVFLFQDTKRKKHSVIISDQSFLERVKEAKESFDIDKLFEVKMRIDIQKNSKRTKKTYTITEVVKSYG